ncbi:MAG: hypothetical protein O3C12_08810 [Proteobacteria bacterium]|nr:hypothetical protein [Pseudomonadota bacterium]
MANFGDKGDLPLPPGRQFAILTCMDARLDPAKYAGGGTHDGKYINWLPFKENAKSVVEDVQRIRNNSMVPKDIPIYGYIYNCKTGQLEEVSEATEAGKAS